MNYGLFFQFIKDFKFPIQKIKNEEYANYILELLESEYGCKTEWNKLLGIIRDEFEGDPELYLKNLYQVRENMMQYIKDLPEFQTFNTGKMDKWIIKDRPEGISSRDIYNCSNVGGLYLSLDLKKANFQALKYAGVLKDFDCYEDLVRKFTDLDYFIGSKHIRQVVFGQLNPGRHITVEKYIINEVRKILEPEIPEDYKLLSQMSDELVWECQYNDYEYPGILVDKVKKELGIDVKAEVFMLSGYSLEPKKNSEFYIKRDVQTKKEKLSCVPSTYYPIVKKLLAGEELCDYDMWLEHDGLRAKFIDTFSLKAL